MHQDDNGKLIPNYVVKSPRECKSIVVKTEDLKYRVLMIHKERKDLRDTKVLSYIRDGERKGYHLRPTCAARERWYDLGKRIPRGFLHPMVHNDRQLISFNQDNVYVDHNLFEIQTLNKSDFTPTILFFISSISPLFKELGGRVNLGQGALKTEGIDIEKLLSIKPLILTNEQLGKLENWLNRYGNSHHESLFSELGANSPYEVSLDKVKADRRELDKIVMGDILGLTDDEQLDVYRAVVDLVKSRIEKAGSFNKKRKIRDGLDIDMFIQTVMEKIGENTLGKFYQENIMAHNLLVTRELPRATGEIKVEHELFGWRLSWSRQHLDCNSEHEARYLKIWMELGMDSIKIPDDIDYLTAITPQLEELQNSIRKIFDTYLDSIVTRKLRQRLQHQLWLEVIKQP